MKWLLAAILVFMGQALLAQPQVPDNAGGFETVDVFVEPTDSPLAAYQLEFFAASGDVKIAGIEGGAHPAFAEPPFYDPKAMQRERVVLAAFSTDAAPNLPVGKTRVATIHVQVRGTNRPEFRIRLQTAANARGKTMAAEATFEERKSK